MTFDAGAPPATGVVGTAFTVTARANGGQGAIGTVIAVPGNPTFCSGNGPGCSASYTPAAAGSVRFTATAYVNDISNPLQAVGSASVSITVQPAVSLSVSLTPADGTTWTCGDATNIVSASVPSGTMIQSIAITGSMSNSCTSSPCTVGMSTAMPGAYNFSATATDVSNVTASTGPISITIKDRTPSVIFIISPPTSIAIGQTVQLTAEEFDNSDKPLCVQPASFGWVIDPAHTTPAGACTVDGSGNLKGLLAGTCAVTLNGPHTDAAFPEIYATVTGTGGFTVSPLAATMPPGGASQGFSATDASNHALSVTWNITGPSSSDACQISGGSPVNATHVNVVTPAHAVGQCILTATSGSNNVPVTITITNAQFVHKITMNPMTATMLPGATMQFSFQAWDINNNIMPMTPSYTVGGACTLGAASSTPFGPTYYASVIAGMTAGQTCSLKATDVSGINSPPAAITISSTFLTMTSPADGSAFLIRNPGTDSVGFAGVVAGAGRVTVTVGGASVPVTVGSPDTTGLASWSGNWIPSAPGQFTASAGTSPPVSRTFYVFFPPPAPTFSAPVDGGKFFTDSNIKLAATAQDNPGNPGGPSGPPPLPGHPWVISNLWFYAGGIGPPIDAQLLGNTWTTTLGTLQRGPYQYTARCLSGAGAYNVPPDGKVNFSVVQRPTASVTVPQQGAVYTSGITMTLRAAMNDPDHLVTKAEFFYDGVSIGAASNSGGDSTMSWKPVADNNPVGTMKVRLTYSDVEHQNQPATVDSPAATFSVADPPSVNIPAQATPNPVNGGLMTSLKAGATSFFGGSALMYQWTQGANDPAAVRFDFGGANSTLNAAFSKAGSYNLTATITDPLNASAKTSITVVVNAAPQISPSPAYVLVGGTKRFVLTGTDQFGNAIGGGSPTWSTDCPSSVGSIGAQSGVFAGNGIGGPCHVIVSVGAQSNSAQVTVTNNIPPTVQITAVTPSNANYVSPLDITLTAGATDPDDAVRQVQFYADGTAIGSAITQSPYTYIWHNMLPGNYYITASATDVNGAVATSTSVPVSVKKPLVNIAKVTPPSATTQDNSVTRQEFVFTVQGSGFVPPTGLPGSLVNWNGTPVFTRFLSGNIVDATLEAHLHNGELLNPQTAIVQVVSPRNSNTVGNSNISQQVSFVVDGQPIVQCVDVWHRGSCSSSSNTQAFHAAALGDASVPHLTRQDQVSALGVYLGGGTQWYLLPEGGQVKASPILFQSSVLPGTSLNLSDLPGGLASGNYVIAAQGTNLAGAVSAPAQATFFLLAADLSAVRVYPNPWRSDQDSDHPTITFDRMEPGSTLKIFTVSGHWAQTLTADGNGQADWDRKNSNGEFVQSGIYLYLITDNQGSKTRGKFAIIR